MAATVHLFIVDRVLVVVVGLQGQLGAAYSALEATRVKEGEILQWANPVHLVHGLRAPQTRALVKVRPIHRPPPRSGSSCLTSVSLVLASSCSSLSCASMWKTLSAPLTEKKEER